MLGERSEVAVDAVSGKLLAVAQYILVIAFGLLPIYFVPVASAPLAYSKVFILAIAVLVAVILYSFSVLRTGSVRVLISWPIVSLWAVTLVAVVSAFFSGDVSDALLGLNLEPHTAGFVGLLALVASVWAVVGTNKVAIMRLYLLLAVSTILLALFHLLRVVLGADVLSFSVFGSSNILSPIGSWNNVAVYFGLTVILSLVTLEQLKLPTMGRILFVIVALLSLAMLAVVNFTAVWVVLGLISLAVLVYSLTKNRFGVTSQSLPKKDSSPFAFVVSVVTLITAVVFIVGGTVVGSAVSNLTNISYLEVRPSFEATVDVAKQVYQEDALLGVGPNRFADAWRVHKDRSINETLFWNTDFQSGVGYLPTFFVTTGIVGGVLWMLFLGLFLWYGTRLLLSATDVDKIWYFIATSSFVSGLYLWAVAWFFVPAPVLLLLAAMCTGLVFASRKALLPESVKTLVIASNQRAGFVVVVVVILIIVGSVGALYRVGQHYSAAYTFSQSARAVSEGANIDEVGRLAALSFSLYQDDRVARSISDLERIRMLNIVNTTSEPDEIAQQEFQNSLANAVSAGRLATELDPTDPNNWGVLGAVYAAVVPLNIDGAYEEAIQTLERARSLDPLNPARLLTLAQVEFFRGNTIRVRELITEAIQLKSNYADAAFFLSQLEISEGNVEAALQSARAAAVLDSENAVRHFQQGLLELSNGNVELAIGAFERAVSIDSQYANARYFLALSYDLAGRQSDAESELNAILVTNPGNSQVLDLLGRLGRGEPLVTAAEDAVAEAPVEEVADTAPTSEDGAITAPAVPDTSLLSPVNVGNETDPGDSSVSENNDLQIEETE